MAQRANTSDERRDHILSVFRAANEAIAAKAAEVDSSEERIPFLCECPDPACTALVLLGQIEYATGRSIPGVFFACRGHEPDGAKVVAAAQEYCLFEQTGRTGDPAGGEHQ